MARTKTLPLLLPTLAVLLLVLTPPSFALSAPPQTGSSEADRITATVRVVDARARSLEVMTGVGHALRLVRMPVDPDCTINVAGRKATLRDLRRGQIVRIQYRTTADDKVAQAIETVELKNQGGQ